VSRPRCDLCSTPCDGAVCPTCEQLARGADFATWVANPTPFDARLEAMIAERGITDPGDRRAIAVFNEFMGQLRAEGSAEEYTRLLLEDATNAGFMPLFTRVANKTRRKKRRRRRQK
jgi:hypothetical protein